MKWFGRAFLVSIFVLMATITVSAYDLIEEEPRQETVLEKNVESEGKAAMHVSMAEGAGLCLMSDNLNCVKVTSDVEE